MLFNEPKLLKCNEHNRFLTRTRRFSALQRAEIAEIRLDARQHERRRGFSALQRAEIAEMSRAGVGEGVGVGEFQCSSTSRNC